MKRTLILSLALAAASAFSIPAANAATTSSTALSTPQIRVQIGRRDHRRGRIRTTTTTRIIREGRHRVRETIRTTYLPNGTVRRTVIRRTRIA